VAAAVATAAALFTSMAGAQSAPDLHATIPAVIETDQRVEPAPRARDASMTEATFGPRLNEGLVAYKPAITTQFEALASSEREMRRPASRRSAALIVVGLSAMVIGSLVDDDAGSIIMLGGAGVTLFGLWQYLR
jgi:hypothetical protein